MVEWRVYGCGSPSSSRSTQTSYELVDGKNSLHIDLGHGAIFRRCLKEKSIETVVDSIQNLLITHCHPDHCFDLTRLYVSWMYTPGFQPQRRVSLYATEETMLGIRRMMDNTRLEGKFESVYDTHIIEYNKPVYIDDFTVIPKATHHIEGACGIRIETPSGKRIAFTSDTGFHKRLFSVWKDVNFLAIECSFFELNTPFHLHLGQVAQVAEKINPECLLLVHFYPDMEQKPDREIQSFLQDRFTGDVHIARDGIAIRWNPQKERWQEKKMF